LGQVPTDSQTIFHLNKQLIIEYLNQFGSGKKRDFMELLLGKAQKENKVKYLLKFPKNSGAIDLDAGNPCTASWILSKKIE
jgi:hypothetical protein